MKMRYEIDLTLLADKTIGEILGIDFKVRNAGGSQKAGIDQKTGIAAMYAAKDLRRYRINAVGEGHTLGEFYQLRAGLAAEFLHIHRLNNLCFTVVRDMYDWMEDEGILNLNVKRYWKKIERTFREYQDAHRTHTDKVSWATVQDHVRLVTDTVYPLIEPLENAIRDFLIQKRAIIVSAGQRDDITLLKKVQCCLMFLAALRNTRFNFFRGYEEEYGIDFSPDFLYADISPIGRNFVSMMEQIGVRFEKDKDGDYVLIRADMNDNYRVNSAWTKIVDIVTDDELMESIALEAINMNPEAKAGYEARVAKIEEEELNERMGDLSTKFNVTRL